MLADAADWIADQYQKLQALARDRFDDDPRHAEIAYNAIIAVCVAAVATVVIVVAWLVISVLGALTMGVAQIAVTGVNWALEHVADWHLTEVVTKPVHDYITAHAVGLPAEAGAIWSAWATVGLVLWLVSWLTRSWSARLAWVLYGAETVAWSTPPARPAGSCSLRAWPSCTGRCCRCSPSAASVVAPRCTSTSPPSPTPPPRWSSCAGRSTSAWVRSVPGWSA